MLNFLAIFAIISAMSMHWLEGEFRKSPDPKDKKRADIIAQMRRERGLDVPLPTDKFQKQDISSNHSEPVPNAPALVLKSESNTIEPTPDLDSVSRYVEKKVELFDRLSQITQPYNEIFSSEVPSRNEERIIKRKLGITRRILPKEPQPKAWKYKGHDFNYYFSLRHSRKGENNNLRSVHMAIVDKNIPADYIDWNFDRYPQLMLNFDLAHFTGAPGIKLRWDESKDEHLVITTKHTLLGEIISEVNQHHQKLQPGYIDGITTKREISIPIHENFNPSIRLLHEKDNRGVRWQEDYLRYVYNLTNDNFIVPSTDKVKFEKSSLPIRERLEKDEFFEVLQNTLTLIPTWDINNMSEIHKL